jgi:hypothetical protein
LAGTKPYWEVPSRFKLAPAWSEKAGSVVHKTDATKIHNDRAFVFTACKKLFLANQGETMPKYGLRQAWPPHFEREVQGVL